MRAGCVLTAGTDCAAADALMVSCTASRNNQAPGTHHFESIGILKSRVMSSLHADGHRRTGKSWRW
jgi:hypothetical protein